MDRCVKYRGYGGDVVVLEWLHYLALCRTFYLHVETYEVNSQSTHFGDLLFEVYRLAHFNMGVTYGVLRSNLSVFFYWTAAVFLLGPHPAFQYGFNIDFCTQINS